VATSLNQWKKLITVYAQVNFFLVKCTRKKNVMNFEQGQTLRTL